MPRVAKPKVKREKSIRKIQSRPIKGGKTKRPAKVQKWKAEEIIEKDYFNRLENSKEFTVDQAVELVMHEAGSPNAAFTDGLRQFIEWAIGTHPGATCGEIRDLVSRDYADLYRYQRLL